ARLAEAALWYLVLEPGLLHLVQGARGGEAFDGGDLLALGPGDRHHAGPDRGAVEVHRARAALCDAAAVLGSGEADLFPDHPEQGGAGIDVDLESLAVDREARHIRPPRVRGPAAC